MTPSILFWFLFAYLSAAKLAGSWIFLARWARRQKSLGFPCGSGLRYRTARRVLALSPAVTPVAVLTLTPPTAFVIFLGCFALGFGGILASFADRLFGTALDDAINRRIAGLARLHLWLGLPPAA